MHAVVDTLTWAAVNPPVTTVIERHVWIGQDVLLLACERVGYGSILAARSVVKGTVPPKVAAGGIPARVLRMDRSWGRDSFAPNANEIALLRMLDGLAAGSAPDSSLTTPNSDVTKPAGNLPGATSVTRSEPEDGLILATDAKELDAAASDAETIWASRLFDPPFYQQQLDEHGMQAGPDLVLHYVETGEALGLLPHRLFDPAYYRAAAGGVCPDGTALVHFIREGSRLGLRTHPLFDAGYYNGQNPDILQSGMNALLHYLNFGGLEGRRPHPLFHSWMYVQGAPRLRDTKQDPLSHYLQGGWREGRNPHPLFETSYYLARYPDVAAAGINPLVHFVVTGLAEGRCPNPLFSSEAFRLSGADPRRLTEEGIAAMETACQVPLPGSC
jgi:hypothetical protein